MTAGPQRRPDASMTLITEVMDRPLDAGYLIAAAQRARGRQRGRGAVAVTLLAAVLCGLLTSAAVAQLRRPVPGAVAARRAVEAEIQRRGDHVDATVRSNAALREQIAGLRADALQRAGAATLADEVSRLGRVAGEVAVAGPGLEVTLDDAPSVHQSEESGAGPGDGAEPGRVLDRDIQIVVNGLWAAGAEAIAVNGYRLTAVSAIRAAGEAVLVDFQPLVPPYRIAAIGDPGRLRDGLQGGMAGAYVDLLRGVGIRATLSARETMELAGSAVTFELTNARPVASAATGGPTPSQEAGP